MNDDDPIIPFDSGFFSGDFRDLIKKIQNLMSDFIEKGNIPEEMEKIIKDLGNQSPFVWGFSFNKGSDGKPHIEQFGDFIKQLGFDLAPQMKKDEMQQSRVPIVDILKDTTSLTVIVELPGVEKKNIDINATEQTLKLKAFTASRKFRKNIKLPVPVIPNSAKAKFKNGVLEISFTRMQANS